MTGTPKDETATVHAGVSGNPHAEAEAEAERLRRNEESAVAFDEIMFNDSRPAEAIVEHGGALQVIPPTSADANTMF